MLLDWVSLIGFGGAVLTTAAFVPQVVKTWKSRSTKDISLAMWSVLCAGIFLWLTYGLLTGDGPLILANSITLCLAGTVLGLKLRYK